MVNEGIRKREAYFGHLGRVLRFNLPDGRASVSAGELSSADIEN